MRLGVIPCVVQDRTSTKEEYDNDDDNNANSDSDSDNDNNNNNNQCISLNHVNRYICKKKK